MFQIFPLFSKKCSDFIEKFRNFTFAAVHKVRHAIFGQSLLPLTPVTLCHTYRDPPTYVTHLGPPPPIFNRPSTKNRTKAPCTNSLSIVRRGFCPEGFVRGSFVWKVLSGVVFVHSPFCQNTSVTTES